MRAHTHTHTQTHTHTRFNTYLHALVRLQHIDDFPLQEEVGGSEDGDAGWDQDRRKGGAAAGEEVECTQVSV